MGRHTLDEVLLPAIERELDRSGAPRFIVIHMMGAHWEYYRRYPKSFQRFGTGQGLSLLSIFFADPKGLSNVVDAYDNAVLYNDWFLHQVIESARGLSVPATVMFISDHGRICNFWMAPRGMERRLTPTMLLISLRSCGSTRTTGPSTRCACMR